MIVKKLAMSVGFSLVHLTTRGDLNGLFAIFVRRFRWGRRGTGWRDSATGANVCSPTARILFGSETIGFVRPVVGDLLEQIFQKTNAPPATGPRTAAFADLTRNARIVNADKVSDLPLRDVEAVTNFVIGFQVEPSSRDLTDSLQSTPA
jgi:hypothetical protein